MSVCDVVRYAAAAASMGAGIIHLTAFDAHREHALIASFFLLTGVFQLAWGFAVAALRSRRLLDIGGLANVGVVGTWLVSRFTGFSFIAGAEHAEPVGIKDASSTLLEVLIVAICAALLLGRRSSYLHALVPLRSITPLAAATVLLIVPGIIVPAHHHDESHHAHSELAAGHAHAAGAGATGHAHDDEHAHAKAADVHADHGAAASGHAHGGVAVAGAHAHNVASHGGHAVAEKAAEPVKAIETLSAKVRYGPFWMPPSSLGGEAHFNRIANNVPKPCTNCYIVEMRPDLVYADGSPANLDTGAMLHHAVWGRPALEDPTCQGRGGVGAIGQRFFASGNERTPFVLPAGFGYHVGSDRWDMIVELMNHVEKARDLYITLDVKYVPASQALKKVEPVWLDVDNCADSQYGVPAGKSHQVWTWTSSMTGRIVAAGGHVHDGGVKTVLTNESAKATMCTSVAGYGTKPAFDGSIESMSFCSWDRIGIVRKGEKLGLHAYYDTPTAQSDVMGIIMAFVYETNDLSGGSTYAAKAPKEQKPPPPHKH